MSLLASLAVKILIIRAQLIAQMEELFAILAQTLLMAALFAMATPLSAAKDVVRIFSDPKPTIKTPFSISAMSVTQILPIQLFSNQA